MKIAPNEYSVMPVRRPMFFTMLRKIVPVERLAA